MSKKGIISVTKEDTEMVGSCNVCHSEEDTEIYFVSMVPSGRKHGVIFRVCDYHVKDLIEKITKIS